MSETPFFLVFVLAQNMLLAQSLSEVFGSILLFPLRHGWCSALCHAGWCVQSVGWSSAQRAPSVPSCSLNVIVLRENPSCSLTVFAFLFFFSVFFSLEKVERVTSIWENDSPWKSRDLQSTSLWKSVERGSKKYVYSSTSMMYFLSPYGQKGTLLYNILVREKSWEIVSFREFSWVGCPFWVLYAYKGPKKYFGGL